MKETLHDYLCNAREAIVGKLDGLGEYDIRRPLTPTGTNLLGLVKHLTIVEAWYFGKSFDRHAAWWEAYRAKVEEAARAAVMSQDIGDSSGGLGGDTSVIRSARRPLSMIVQGSCWQPRSKRAQPPWSACKSGEREPTRWSRRTRRVSVSDVVDRRVVSCRIQRISLQRAPVQGGRSSERDAQLRQITAIR